MPAPFDFDIPYVEEDGRDETPVDPPLSSAREYQDDKPPPLATGVEYTDFILSHDAECVALVPLQQESFVPSVVARLKRFFIGSNNERGECPTTSETPSAWGLWTGSSFPPTLNLLRLKPSYLADRITHATWLRALPLPRSFSKWLNERKCGRIDMKSHVPGRKTPIGVLLVDHASQEVVTVGDNITLWSMSNAKEKGRVRAPNRLALLCGAIITTSSSGHNRWLILGGEDRVLHCYRLEQFGIAIQTPVVLPGTKSHVYRPVSAPGQGVSGPHFTFDPPVTNMLPCSANKLVEKSGIVCGTERGRLMVVDFYRGAEIVAHRLTSSVSKSVAVTKMEIIRWHRQPDAESQGKRGSRVSFTTRADHVDAPTDIENVLLVGCASGVIYGFTLPTLQAVLRLEAHRSMVLSLSAPYYHLSGVDPRDAACGAEKQGTSPFLVTGCAGRQLKVWNHKLSCIIAIPMPSFVVHCHVVDRSNVFTVCGDNVLRYHDFSDVDGIKRMQVRMRRSSSLRHLQAPSPMSTPQIVEDGGTTVCFDFTAMSWDDEEEELQVSQYIRRGEKIVVKSNQRGGTPAHEPIFESIGRRRRE